MPRFARFAFGILFLILFIAAVGLFLGYKLIKKSLPQTNGTLQLVKISDQIKIYRDEFGVPYIFANNEHDLYFALGFVQAQDRFWQMDYNRRIALGKLSEIFGARTLAVDRYFRTVGFSEIAHHIEEKLSPESREILTNYTAGINIFLEKNRDRLPLEFSILNYKPEKWQLVHSLAIQRFVAWTMEMGWHVDPVCGLLANKIPAQKLQEIIFDPAELNIVGKQTDKFEYEKLMRFFDQITYSNKKSENFVTPTAGSNGWIVSGNRSESGKPLLANDPHLLFQNPSIWYEIVLISPEEHCSGVSIPGLPGIVIGNNQSVAWGLTNVMADGCDFFIEKIHPQDSSKYWYNGKWQPVAFQTDTIFVKDERPAILKFRKTHHGPVISDADSNLNSNDKVLSVQWTGTLISDEVLAFSKIIKSHNIKQFVEALRLCYAPVQNFMYADTAGNIGCFCAGKIPIRAHGHGLIPKPGWLKNYEWTGYIPIEKLPRTLNPQDGAIVTANNNIVENKYPYFISNYWEPPYREQRINQLLSSKQKFNLTDFKNFQFDLYSLHAQSMMEHILKILPEFDRSTQLRQFFYQTLKTWDFRLHSESIGASIFEIFLRQLYFNIYMDEMGDFSFNKFLSLPSVPIRITDNLLSNHQSLWFDDVTTLDKKETMDEILLKSLEGTFEYMKNDLGEIIQNWQWGQQHTILLEHPLGKVKPLNYLFNIGPFPIGGSATTINLASYWLNQKNFNVVISPSMRQLVDLTNASLALRILPTGQSGHPLSARFKDQTSLWLAGNYRPVTLDTAAIARSNFDVLILEPYK